MIADRGKQSFGSEVVLHLFGKLAQTPKGHLEVGGLVLVFRQSVEKLASHVGLNIGEMQND